MQFPENIKYREEVERPLFNNEIDENFKSVANPWQPFRVYKEGHIVYYVESIGNSYYLNLYRAKKRTTPESFIYDEWDPIGGGINPINLENNSLIQFVSPKEFKSIPLYYSDNNFYTSNINNNFPGSFSYSSFKENINEWTEYLTFKSFSIGNQVSYAEYSDNSDILYIEEGCVYYFRIYITGSLVNTTGSPVDKCTIRLITLGLKRYYDNISMIGNYTEEVFSEDSGTENWICGLEIDNINKGLKISFNGIPFNDIKWMGKIECIVLKL